MAVRSDLRNHGIGGTLITAAIGRARSMGARMLFLRTSPELADAIRLYRRAGFRRIASDPLGCCKMCRKSFTMKIDLVRSERNTPRKETAL
jgi:N-acetylglutamate synthase-like GNAT family acetyltransferase